MPKHGKKYSAVRAKIDSTNRYTLEEALDIIAANPTAKFDEGVDIAIRLGVNPRHSDQMVRGACALPNGTGKTVRILVFAKGEKEKEAKDAGADYVGAEDLIEKIQGGWFDFDVMIATPDMMPKVAKLGRVLGPRGLMPNPKAGTVTTDLAGAIQEFKAGKLEFRADRTGIVHVRFGKASFAADALLENLKTLQETIDRNKPSGAKGRYWKSLYVTSTMGPSVEVDVAALQDIKQEG